MPGIIRGKIQKFIIASMAALLLAGLGAPLAHAADFNLTASPLPVNLSTKPGVPVSTPLRVQNTSNAPVTVSVSLKKFGPTDKSGKPTILDPGPHDDFIRWVHFSETSFLAEPNVWHSITMTISPPKDAGFGYYYAVVFSADTGNQNIQTDKLHSRVKGAIASLVLLDVNAPGEKRTLQIKSFVSEHKVYEYLPAKFTITVHNAGNVHAVPGGDIFISKNGKDNLGTLDINNGSGNVLPKTDRQFEVSWNDGFPVFQLKKAGGQALSDKNGKPIRALNWNGLNFSKFRFGRYHAHLLMTYNDGTRDVPVEGDLTFWVLPWKMMLVLLTILALIIAGSYFALRGAFGSHSRQTKKRK